MNIKYLSVVIALCFGINASAQKYVGGDISLLTKYEEHGAKYYTHTGETISDVLGFFADEKLNAMRVRLFVDPSKAPAAEVGEGVCQDLDYVCALGKRIKSAGMALMLDIHYSDSWADPAKQYTPDAWTSLDDDALVAKVYDYTADVLKAMTEAGATPDFIQTGNEISYGMLWGARGASASSMKSYYAGNEKNAARFFALLKSAGKACREKCPDAKIVIHTERVQNTDYTKQFYDDMATARIDYDIIGLSYYPYFHGTLSQLEKCLSQTETAFPEKKIMIVEAGYPYAWEVPGSTYDYTSMYPYSDEGQLNFTEDLIRTLNRHDSVTGLFWWFMEANECGLDWNTQRVTDKWYNAPLFDNRDGRATSALSALKNFLPSSGISDVNAAKGSVDSRIFTIDGRLVDTDGKSSQLPAGLYVSAGKKIAVR